MVSKIKISLFVLFAFCCALAAPQDAAEDAGGVEAAAESRAAGVAAPPGDAAAPAVAGMAEVPPAREPLMPDPEKAAAAAAKDESPDAVEKNSRALEFGVSEEIVALIKSFTENEDPRYATDLYDLFHATKNVSVRERIIEYFDKLNDPCIADYAVTVLNDPFDERRSTVSLCISYVTTIKCTQAMPALITLLEADNDDYFNEVVIAIGELGGTSEALYLTELFRNDETTTNRKQALMRALGKIQAHETWADLVEIAQNNDENAFVRMYAAEALGNMKRPDSIEVLADLFEAGDPNLRQYVIKGLRNFPDSGDARAVIIQGIRDDHYRVRMESIKAAGEMELKEAVPSLLYRVENDKENVVKKECWQVIAALNTQEGNDFLVGVLADKKKSDATKISAAEALLKEGNAGESEIITLALSTVSDDARKQLRYNIGKSLVKYARPSFEGVCTEYLASKDVSTVAIGLDMYLAGKFSGAEAAVQAIASDKKAGNNQKLAKRILGIEEE